MSFRTRFAPSPTGPLHLGHAYSAMLAHDMALAEGGEFLLRIEDIDQSRSRPEWEEQIYDDLRWLGLSWEEPVMRQSARMEAYRDAIDVLWDAGLLFPCHCTRRDIREAANAPQEGAVPYGPDGIIYPGTCKTIPRPSELPMDAALRLDMEHALSQTEIGKTFDNGEGTTWLFPLFEETGAGPMGQNGFIGISVAHMIDAVGDIVIARRDMGTSYHLSVVVDDAAQNITHVVRGQDLFEATYIHVALQRLLHLETPTYHHHKLIRDDEGKRLAKRDDARAIRKYREDGATPEDIRRMVGL